MVTTRSGAWNDSVARMQDAALDDLSAQSAAVAEALVDAGNGKRFEMTARLAQADAAQNDVTNAKLLADEVIERHVARDEITAGLSMFRGIWDSCPSASIASLSISVTSRSGPCLSE